MYLKNPLSRRFTQIAAVVLSGLLWYISNGLHGDYWYLLWIAPLPILLVSFESSAKEVFSLSLIANLIGRLSWFSYLVNVVDDRLHSRMAIKRGVENGFSMFRTARLGRLTISDPWC